METSFKNHITPSLSFRKAVKSSFSKYATFSGRARRSEFWWFQFFWVAIYFAMIILLGIGGALGKELGGGNALATILVIIYGIFTIALLALIIPSIAVTVRRLHDVGKSGWYYFISFIPFIGLILLLYWVCLDSEPTTNEYGPSVKYY